MAPTRPGLVSVDCGSRLNADDPWLRVHRKAMGCRFEVTLSRERGDQVSAAVAVMDEADRIEAMVSVFREDTETARLNSRAATAAAEVSPELFALIERCLTLHGETDGAFDVTSTPLSRCWGFLRREERVPDAAVLASARRVVGMPHVRIDRERRTVAFDRAGVELNFGAIGKGYAVDRLGHLLRGSGVGQALVSAGSSSVLALGGRDGGWLVDIRSPRLVNERIARVALRRGALGTSGVGEHESGAEPRYGHVIDPRSGSPARGVLSSTVVTREAATADALSTAFLIGGPELARRYCDEHDHTLALLVLENDPDNRLTFGRYRGARIEL